MTSSEQIKAKAEEAFPYPEYSSLYSQTYAFDIHSANKQRQGYERCYTDHVPGLVEALNKAVEMLYSTGFYNDKSEEMKEIHETVQKYK